jgi:hypothetical protein
MAAGHLGWPEQMIRELVWQVYKDFVPIPLKVQDLSLVENMKTLVHSTGSLG